MNYQIKDTLILCFRWIRTWQRLCGFLSVLLAMNLLGILLPTSANAVELVSVNKDGNDSGNYNSFWPVISADGRFVAFHSYAEDLVANDSNGTQDVFVRDLHTRTTILISSNKDGTGAGNRESNYPIISADGRFIAFTSFASDLTPADTNQIQDVFVRNLQSGSTALVSINREGTASANSLSEFPVISSDGRFVAFVSYASDLATTDTNYVEDVYVRDLLNGITTLVSINKDGTNSGNNTSSLPKISADGRFVVFASGADDLVETDNNDTGDVFVRDLKSGTTSLVSLNANGTAAGNGFSYEPMISADGRFVAFSSYADDLVTADTNGNSDVFVRDLQNGATTLVSVDRDGTDSGNNQSYKPAISPDGRFVAFISDSNNLVALDTYGLNNYFVRDLQSQTTTLVSVNKNGTGSQNFYPSEPVISSDGRFVAFSSNADDLVATDTNNLPDVFLRDLQSGTTTLLSVNKDGTDSGNDISITPVISADGRFVAFPSYASDLVGTDTNGNTDVFVFDASQAPHGCNCTDPVAIKGTSGRDILFGTEQADIICGFEGQDFIAGMGGDDCIDGGEGNDWIYGGRGNDTIYGRAGNDVIYGDRGNDVISGDDDEDYLFGGSGDDKLDGGEGYDWIFCDGGTDEGVGEYLWKCEN